MPQLKIRGVEVEKICSFSKNLIDELEDIINCPRSYFTIEHISSTFIADGSVTKSYPFVEVSWFDRGQEVQDKTALAITKAVQCAGYENVDVVFTALKENEYYENGNHF
ncbi:MAG: hypothetical protein H6Q58_1893 [Firmicutes bacterium]|nr:hypothetical protein [Bacillota bacterium]